ncbi:MAG: signal peptidase I [Candidatus Lloydbacteria bacterium RIFCSPHIGHO2_02_FULL_54_17]|uniref:Signal peptidase I n=1 Tax=Candidatus Lloydbacteria bacterium RIFCSPHIGHO2_02_FULL_54_17 TaxID=1798664 RepID=A0A1G2DDF8_9BACT|nr:MAG: signal peptidase I [Candidatus Lloydbacteria bacterium RIFCSPHIGHO2_01_FULL_54_11]OGZ11616.1 MAG: signal peptidase I [Candidatus Lloydbacteria bacterium RIFCSPHIGHO2_02_FULL_54_17]OGZ13926.1 MAG: signal peptidase I [Candidatus Lloydbacteria bacterium RIFCSPLOWO2_01_FULL_54_18]OGZ16988.1 MAG: signal peptidase I [Candidatus Lloydbacteria bacterium RIFCSPLOWO2_02_FULL_54_12]
MSTLGDSTGVMSGERPTQGESADSSTQKERTPHGRGGVIGETLRYALVAAIIIIPVRMFIAQPFVVSGNSMLPTFHNGEYLIVNELAKYVGEYERGDVVILRYPVDPSKYFIKRVIGLPEETVSITNGTVSITGAMHASPLVLTEPYVKNQKPDEYSRTLSSEEYFVMGDNRAQSSDSRVWGPVPAKLMGGKALLRLFPFNVITLHPGGISSFDAEASNAGVSTDGTGAVNN